MAFWLPGFFVFLPFWLFDVSASWSFAVPGFWYVAPKPTMYVAPVACRWGVVNPV